MSELLANWNIYLTSFFLLSGAGFMLLAAIGIVKLPDLPNRLHASTKAGALGVSLMLFAVIVFIPQLAVVAKALAIITFILLTSPVAAHVLGRTGYFVGVPLWEGTVRDDLEGHYNPLTHELISGLEEDDEEGEEQDAHDAEESQQEESGKKKVSRSSKTDDTIMESPDLVEG